MSLGTCERPLRSAGSAVNVGFCGGPLCISGREVVCERCGWKHETHPVAVADAAAREAARQKALTAKPSDRVSGPEEYASTIFDRVMVLERTIKALEARLTMLEDRPSNSREPVGEMAMTVKRGPGRPKKVIENSVLAASDADAGG